MATSPFLQNYDDIFQDILTNYSNLDPSPDISQGSVVYIKSAVLASCLWGLYRYQDYISNQVFPDTADSDGLNHWGAIYGVTRVSTDTDSDYLTKILTAIRQPPAGGNTLDYFNWAMASVTADNPQFAYNAIPGNTSGGGEVFAPSAVNTGTDQITVGQVWRNTEQVQFSSTGSLPAPLLASTNYYVIYVSDTLVSVSATSGGGAINITTQGTGEITMQATDNGKYYIGNASIITPMSPQPSSPGTVQVWIVPYDVLTNTKQTSFNNIRYAQIVDTLSTIAQAYINNLRPVTALANPVAGATAINIPIYVTVTPSNLQYSVIQQMQTDIANYVNSLNPGSPLYVAQISAVCLRDGAVNASVYSDSGFSIPMTDYITANTNVVVSQTIVVQT